MPVETAFYAPVGYPLWWPLAGVGLVLACLGWTGWVLLQTRPGNDADVPGFLAPRNPETVRARYLGVIGGICARHDAGGLTLRAAHGELSTAVRSFVYEMTGVKAQRMTLAELRERQLPLVADAVAAFYPAEFAVAGGPVDVASSAAFARNVVTSWR
ncbi:MAG: hypothetical protein WBX27_00180 [Specibacter sp.]